MSENTKCEHKMCGCPVAGEEKYCSDHCREATDQEIAEIACDCGCAGCK